MRVSWKVLLAGVLPFVLGAGPQTPPPSESVAILIAARDLAIGQKVTEQDVLEIKIPSAWTQNVVRADSRQYIIGQSVQLPVLTRDMLTWSSFELTHEKGLVSDCAQAVGLPPSATEQVARLRQLFIESPPRGP